MEATMAQRLLFPTFVNSDNAASRASLSLPVSQGLKNQRKPRGLVFKSVSSRRRNVALEVSCTYKSVQVESETQQAYFDESLLLKEKSEEIEPYLSGQCIYLVGMMGSGKTTVGKILSKALGYSFFDCDTLIERELGGISVSDIFKHRGEAFFRDKETKVLQQLSFMHRHVISTGGGAVIRPINWKYMNKGVSVYLDVPLDALARRIAAVGTGSRPLLPNDTGDVYTITLKRLSSLFDARGEAYTNATVRASLENMADKSDILDVCDITPTAIAIEALDQIANFLKKEGHNAL